MVLLQKNTLLSVLLVGLFQNDLLTPYEQLLINIPQSWYIDENYNIVTPKYRKNFTDYRVRLKDFVDYLDGTKKYIKEYTRTK